MRRLYCVTILFLLFWSLSPGQEQEEVEFITGAFRSNRVINSHAIESTRGGVLDMKISHRFGTLNSGFFQFYGLDNAMIRLGVDYGISDRLTVGLGRSSFRDIWDGFVKYKFLWQSTGKREMPITVAGLVAMDLIGTKNNPDPENVFSSRFAYTYQLLIGRKFSEDFSLQLMPTLVHRNLVEFDEENDVWAIGIAARQDISPTVSITAEYFYVPGDQLPSGDDSGNNFHNSLSLGVDILTGGHVFQLHLSNSTSMAHSGFLTQTTGEWLEGDIHFGFNITRIFFLNR